MPTEAPTKPTPAPTAPTASRVHADKYLETKVLSASPSELRLMLLDGAIKFCRQGRDGLMQRQYEAMYNGFTRCRAILVELMTTAKPEPDRALYDRVIALYTFLIMHLMEASIEKDVKKADKVVELITFERETWAMVMAKAAAEQRAAGGPSAGAPDSVSVQG